MTVDDGKYVGLESSIAIDSSNNVHISYYDIAHKDLKYATKAGISHNADISVSKADNPDPVQVEQQLVYTVTITNNSLGDATGVRLTDTLPGAVNFVSATSSQGTCTEEGGVVTCNIGGMTSGAYETVTIIVTAPNAEGEITNTATVDCTSNDPDMSNNTDTEDTNVQSPELSIEEIIDIFDQGVDDGTIAGSSGFFWGQIQLNIMRRHLTRARYLIERGYIGAACWRLRSAYRGCDGEGYNWITGDGVEELAQSIFDLAVSLDCWWT